MGTDCFVHVRVQEVERPALGDQFDGRKAQQAQVEGTASQGPIPQELLSVQVGANLLVVLRERRWVRACR